MRSSSPALLALLVLLLAGLACSKKEEATAEKAAAATADTEEGDTPPAAASKEKNKDKAKDKAKDRARKDKAKDRAAKAATAAEPAVEAQVGVGGAGQAPEATAEAEAKTDAPADAARTGAPVPEAPAASAAEAPAPTGAAEAPAPREDEPEADDGVEVVVRDERELDLGHLITLADATRIMKKAPPARAEPLAGALPSREYNGVRFAPAADTTLGATVQVWRFSTTIEARRRFDLFSTRTIGAESVEALGSQGYFTQAGNLLTLAFLEQTKKALVVVTCSEDTCDLKDLYVLAKEIEKKL